MNVASDTKICHQDLYLLYMDFRSAFITVNDDKLLHTMYDLGSPTDATGVKASLNTDATTRINLDFALTDHIELGRGTMQGDISLPILFLIIIDSLLRWLQPGGADTGTCACATY